MPRQPQLQKTVSTSAVHFNETLTTPFLDPFDLVSGQRPLFFQVVEVSKPQGGTRDVGRRGLVISGANTLDAIGPEGLHLHEHFGLLFRLLLLRSQFLGLRILFHGDSAKIDGVCMRCVMEVCCEIVKDICRRQHFFKW